MDENVILPVLAQGMRLQEEKLDIVSNTAGGTGELTSTATSTNIEVSSSLAVGSAVDVLAKTVLLFLAVYYYWLLRTILCG